MQKKADMALMMPDTNNFLVIIIAPPVLFALKTSQLKNYRKNVRATLATMVMTSSPFYGKCSK